MPTNALASFIFGCPGGLGSSTGLFHVGPTKVKACKSFLFTDHPLKVENREHLVDLVVTLNRGIVSFHYSPKSVKGLQVRLQIINQFLSD